MAAVPAGKSLGSFSAYLGNEGTAPQKGHEQIDW
jgi:hypothetical protein